MTSTVDLYGTAYGNFAAQILEQVRRETYGEDFGQSSWVTGPEYRRFFCLLGLAAADHVLDVGCGSGGPALFLAGHAAFKLVVWRYGSWARVAGIAVLAVLGLAATVIPELALAACAAGVVASVAASDRLPGLHPPR